MGSAVDIEWVLPLSLMWYEVLRGVCELSHSLVSRRLLSLWAALGGWPCLLPKETMIREGTTGVPRIGGRK